MWRRIAWTGLRPLRTTFVQPSTSGTGLLYYMSLIPSTDRFRQPQSLQRGSFALNLQQSPLSKWFSPTHSTAVPLKHKLQADNRPLRPNQSSSHPNSSRREILTRPLDWKHCLTGPLIFNLMLLELGGPKKPNRTLHVSFRHQVTYYMDTCDCLC
jgi:hypothetical protein